MSGENNLATLLQSMSPSLQEGSFVFLTSNKGFSADILEKSVMIFKEAEGTTVIIRTELAKTLSSALPQWAMVTLTIHSDLNAVGFLAAITERLAEAGISVNAVSAYYHDHLFVPWVKREEAMNVLHSFGKRS